VRIGCIAFPSVKEPGSQPQPGLFGKPRFELDRLRKRAEGKFSAIAEGRGEQPVMRSQQTKTDENMATRL